MSGKYTNLLLVRQRMKEEAIEESAIAEDATAETTIEDSAIAKPAIVENTIATVAIEDPEPQPSQIAAIANSAVAGFTRVPNVILDRIMATLKPSDQSVLLRLYRLSRGFGKETCVVGYGTLSRACNLSIRQAQTCIERLVQAGHIERLTIENSGKQNQSKGSEYRVNLPAPSAIDKSATANSATAGSAAYKDKALKETSKAIDARACPDCLGTGFWYPQGIGKGVAKCKHLQLSKS